MKNGNFPTRGYTNVLTRVGIATVAVLMVAMAPNVVQAAEATSTKQVGAYGNAAELGGPDANHKPLVGMASTLTGNGYWIAASDGGVFSFGDATFYGSLGAVHLNQPIIGITRTISGNGYWLFARDGGVFSFGDARFLGSTGSINLNEPISAMFATPSGNGYWLVALDGGVFTFGDAKFLGGATEFANDGSVISGFSSASGNGYTLITTTGAVYNYGNAIFQGNMLRGGGDSPIVEATPTPDHNGYWMLAKDGAVFTFGSAQYHGGANGSLGNHPAISLASTMGGNGYYIISGDENQPGITGRLVGTFSATCYSLGGHTATGNPVGDNVVAVDPRVISLGTRMYVEGVGARTALDTGGAIKGNRLDIWKSTKAACSDWGRRDVKVWVF